MTNKNIIIVYFIWININRDFYDVIGGQLDDINYCNVLSNGKIFLVICNEHPHLNNQIIDFVNNKLSGKEFEIEFHEDNKYEYYGIKKIYDLAVSFPDKTFLYMHSKGMWHGENYHGIYIDEKTLTRTTINNWNHVLDVFNNPYIARIGMFPSRGNFVWFNFWWVKGNYLITCQNPIITEDRYYYEHWLGTGDNSSVLTYNLDEGNFNQFDPPGATEKLISMRGRF